MGRPGQWTRREWMAAGLGTALAAPAAWSADYPDRPITLVVPTGPGGITDVLARLLAEKLHPLLRQPLIVDNRPGASGVIGSGVVANARPDGYTLLFAFPTHVANPSTIRSLPYDTRSAFVPVAQVGQVSEVLLVAKDSGFDSMKSLLAKARGGATLNYGSVGAGSQGDICTLVFLSKARVKMVSVPYKSEPEMLTALLRDDIQIAFTSPPASLPMISGGKLRGLAISSAKRLPILPDVPTVAEAGLPGYDVTGWNGIFAPRGTPPAVVERLNRAINQVLADPQVVGQFLGLGVPPLGGTPGQLQQAVVRDIDLIAKTLASVGFVPQ